ncbi:MAG: histone deacetylase [Archangium sp.]|nr:histone deacetylase [Archangium sp.]
MNRLEALFARSRRKPITVVYDEAYRLPLSGAEAVAMPIETRRCDDALSYALHQRAFSERHVVAPTPISYEALSRVHTAAYLESLQDPLTLARIFAVDPSDVYVDELLRTVRLACGGTLWAARHTLATKRPTMNLLGGFHHAAPDRGGGFCAVNDMAVAIAALRAEGFTGRVAVLDFDCHPPDGTAACLGHDPSVWLGSVSGTSWSELDGVDDVVLPEGSTDEPYLEAVQTLLTRMPDVQLVFVLAGGDVLAGDRLGTLKLSLHGVRRRDLLVIERLGSLPQVWLPAGGYSAHAWKVLAGTALALAFRSTTPISTDADPLASRMSRIARSLPSESLSGEEDTVTDADIAEALSGRRAGPPKLLGFYTAEGLEFALEQYRILPLLRRLGFDELHVVIDRAGLADRARLMGRDTTRDTPVTLVQLEVERRRVGDGTFLFVNWLSMRNPRAQFSSTRPKLPGQETPGLGLAKEMTQLLGLMAKRLVLDGVAFQPSWFHMAFTARHTARFLSPERQGRFEALVRDLRTLPLLVSTRAVAEGRVLLNGQPYTWEANEMIAWRELREDPAYGAAVAHERERCHFTVVPSPGAPS